MYMEKYTSDPVKVILVVIVIGLGASLFYQGMKYRSLINQEVKKREQLIKSKDLEINDLEEKVQHKGEEVARLKGKLDGFEITLNEIKDEREETDTDVYSYNERKLDSILTNYQRPGFSTEEGDR